MQAVAGWGLRKASVGSMYVKEKTPYDGDIALTLTYLYEPQLSREQIVYYLKVFTILCLR